MTELAAQVERLFQPRIGDAAAAALVSDFARHPGPKHGVVVGGGASSPVLVAGRRRAGPDDTLTVVAGADAEERDLAHRDGRLLDRRSGYGWSRRWPTPSRRRDHPRRPGHRCSADEIRDELESLAKHLSPGGVVSVAGRRGGVPGRRRGRGTRPPELPYTGSAATWSCAMCHRYGYTGCGSPRPTPRWPSG